MIGILLFGTLLMSSEGLVHLVHLLEDGHPVSKSLVQEVGDLDVLVNLLVSVEIGLEQIKIAVSKLLKGGLHGSSEGCIGVFEIALALVGGLGARCFVDLCTSTSTRGGFASGTS